MNQYCEETEVSNELSYYDRLEYEAWSDKVREGARLPMPEDFDLCPNGMHTLHTCNCTGHETVDELPPF